MCDGGKSNIKLLLMMSYCFLAEPCELEYPTADRRVRHMPAVDNFNIEQVATFTDLLFIMKLELIIRYQLRKK